MSSAASESSPRPPLIALVHRANREMQSDMVREAQKLGFTEAKYAHNSVFGTLTFEGARSADMAQAAGITRQSMGEVIRDLVGLGLVEMKPDPDDRRAKIVSFTEEGRREAMRGYRHIQELEQRLVAELGEEVYEHVRLGLEKIVELLAEDGDR